MGNAMWVVAVAGWLLTIGGLAVAAHRAELPPETLRFGRTVSVLTSVSLALTFVAFLVWSVGIAVQDRQSHVAGAIIATYPRHGLSLAMAIGLAIASLASLWGATSARRSWRTIYSERLWDV
jgi:hypothetical protein